MQPAAPLPALVPAGARALVLATALLLLGAGAIPPGLEAQVSALVLRRPEDAPLPGSYRVGDVKIEREQIRVALVGDEGEGEVFLLPRAGEAGPHFTPSFEARLPPGAPPAFLAAAEAFLARLRDRDDGSFAARVGARREALQLDPESEIVPEPTRDPLLPQWLVVEAFFLLSLGLLLADGLRSLSARPALRPLAGLGAGAFLLALSGRLLLPPWSPLHADRHGMLEIGGLAGLWPGEGAARADLYGPAYRRLLAPIAGLLEHPDWPFVAAALAGALSVPALLLLGRRLSGRWSVGALAALGLMIHPGHLRLSLSESPWPLALFLFAAGTWALARGLNPDLSRLDRALRLLAGFLALAVAMQLRVVTLLLGPLALALALVPHLQRWRGALKLLLLPTLGLAGIGLAHLHLLGGHLAEGVSRGVAADPRSVGQMLGESLQLASPLLLVLALLGLAALLWQRRLALAGLLLAAPIALSLPSWQVALTCRTDLIRYQSPPHFFLILAAAMALGAVPAARQRLATLLVGGALILASGPGLSFTLPPDLHDLAFVGVRESAGQLPPRLQVLAQPRWSEGRRVQAVFPAYLLTARGLEVETGGGESDAPCFVYLGPGCYAFTTEELEAGAPPTLGGEPIRPACLALPARLPASETEATLGRRLEVPWAQRDFHRLPARRPWVGLFPCREEARPGDSDGGGALLGGAAADDGRAGAVVEGVEVELPAASGDGVGADVP